MRKGVRGNTPSAKRQGLNWRPQKLFDRAPGICSSKGVPGEKILRGRGHSSSKGVTKRERLKKKKRKVQATSRNNKEE